MPFVVQASASLLYVASYAGTISTLELQKPSNCKASASLRVLATNTECWPNPSWLILDQSKSRLYCAERGLNNPNGTLHSFSTSSEGSLAHLGSLNTIGGGVSTVIYGQDGTGLGLAQYTTSSFQTFSVSNPATISPLQSWTWRLEQPGPVLPNQNAPHPHQAILDPTAKFLLVPDLGADLVRIFAIKPISLELTSTKPLVAAPGSGPRHAAFRVTETKVFFYLLAELGNTVSTYEVSYTGDDLEFNLIQVVGTHGEGNPVPTGAAAAEIHLSPDSRFLIISSRNENSFTVPNFDSSNSTVIPSDSIISFSIDPQNGYLKLAQIFPAGGRVPRQFSINKAGTVVAVGLQSDGRVVAISRDAGSGQLKGFIASASIAGEVVCVIFDE